MKTYGEIVCLVTETFLIIMRRNAEKLQLLFLKYDRQEKKLCDVVLSRVLKKSRNNTRCLATQYYH